MFLGIQLGKLGLRYFSSPQCLVLVDRRAAAERVIHELVEGALIDVVDLEGPDGAVGGATLPIHAVGALTPGL